MSKKENTPPPSIFERKGILAGIIIAAVILLAGILYTTGTLGGSAAVPPEECGKTVISYVNTNLAGNATATLVSVTEKNGVYNVSARYEGKDLFFFASKDCTYLFSTARNMKETPQPAATPVPTPVPVKSARPSVQLFVMSFCPYGVQAENAMKPVADLLGTKADIQVHYIATVSGDSVDSVQSLHGTPEAKEDLRQLCVATYSPQKYWSYLMAVNAQCYPVYRDARQLEQCQKNVTATLGIDTDAIETCAGGSEGLGLLRADVAIAKNLKIAMSPTLILNGQGYNGQRTPEAYKQAICDRFETPPAECSVNLAGQAVAASSGTC
jgi:Gamma interferon inducible lysosomal thiol reductase (GILT)